MPYILSILHLIVLILFCFVSLPASVAQTEGGEGAVVKLVQDTGLPIGDLADIRLRIARIQNAPDCREVTEQEVAAIIDDLETIIAISTTFSHYYKGILKYKLGLCQGSVSTLQQAVSHFQAVYQDHASLTDARQISYFSGYYAGLCHLAIFELQDDSEELQAASSALSWAAQTVAADQAASATLIELKNICRLLSGYSKYRQARDAGSTTSAINLCQGALQDLALPESQTWSSSIAQFYRGATHYTLAGLVENVGEKLDQLTRAGEVFDALVFHGIEQEHLQCFEEARDYASSYARLLHFSFDTTGGANVSSGLIDNACDRATLQYHERLVRHMAANGTVPDLPSQSFASDLVFWDALVRLAAAMPNLGAADLHGLHNDLQQLIADNPGDVLVQHARLLQAESRLWQQVRAGSNSLQYPTFGDVSGFHRDFATIAGERDLLVQLLSLPIVWQNIDFSLAVNPAIQILHNALDPFQSQLFPPRYGDFSPVRSLFMFAKTHDDYYTPLVNILEYLRRNAQVDSNRCKLTLLTAWAKYRQDEEGHHGEATTLLDGIDCEHDGIWAEKQFAKAIITYNQGDQVEACRMLAEVGDQRCIDIMRAYQCEDIPVVPLSYPDIGFRIDLIDATQPGVYLKPGLRLWQNHPLQRSILAHYPVSPRRIDACLAAESESCPGQGCGAPTVACFDSYLPKGPLDVEVEFTIVFPATGDSEYQIDNRPRERVDSEHRPVHSLSRYQYHDIKVWRTGYYPWHIRMFLTQSESVSIGDLLRPAEQLQQTNSLSLNDSYIVDISNAVGNRVYVLYADKNYKYHLTYLDENWKQIETKDKIKFAGTRRIDEIVYPSGLVALAADTVLISDYQTNQIWQVIDFNNPAPLAHDLLNKKLNRPGDLHLGNDNGSQILYVSNNSELLKYNLDDPNLTVIEDTDELNAASSQVSTVLASVWDSNVVSKSSDIFFDGDGLSFPLRLTVDHQGYVYVPHLGSDHLFFLNDEGLLIQRYETKPLTQRVIRIGSNGLGDKLIAGHANGLTVYTIAADNDYDPHAWLR